MKNKAIVELGFRKIRRILQISESVIHLSFGPLWITPSLICRIIHIYPTKPRSIIAKNIYSITFTKKSNTSTFFFLNLTVPQEKLFYKCMILLHSYQVQDHPVHRQRESKNIIFLVFSFYVYIGKKAYTANDFPLEKTTTSSHVPLNSDTRHMWLGIQHAPILKLTFKNDNLLF